ncbi:MAG: glycosyltransferase family 2 protein [Terriglobia bacterium]
MCADVSLKYSIVVPFYNESENIRPLYEKLVEVMEGVGHSFELVFVDDGSTDPSFRILREIQNQDSRVHLLRLRRNFGQTPALKAGFDFAEGEIILSMDGDLQHDPEEIPQFLSKIEEGYDVVSGWRFERTDNWLTRQLPSRVANWLMSKIARVEIHDFGTTFKAYRREIIKNIQLYGELHRFIPALASGLGATIVEIPIKNRPRLSGKSKYGLSRTFGVFLDLISIKFFLDYSTRPLQFFGRLGLITTGSGAALGFFLLVKKLVFQQAIMLQHGPLIFLAMLLLLGGVQFLTIGLVGEMLSRTYYESQNKPIYNVSETRSGRRTGEGERPSPVGTAQGPRP